MVPDGETPIKWLRVQGLLSVDNTVGLLLTVDLLAGYCQVNAERMAEAYGKMISSKSLRSLLGDLALSSRSPRFVPRIRSRRRSRSSEE